MLIRCALLTALAVTACSAPIAGAATYTGSISPPQVSSDGGTVTAQIAVTATCDTSEYCGFFPEVMTVAATQPCVDVINGSEWIGPVVFASYGSVTPPSISATASWSEWPTLFSGAKHACLYADTTAGSVLVAQADYVVPAPPAPAPVYVPPVVTAPAPVTAPVPPPAPTVDTPAPQSLSRTEAIGVMRSWLKRKYGRRWTRGRQRVVKCPVRSSDAQLGCYGVWLYGHRVMSRIEVVTETEDSYVFSKDFFSAPAQDDGSSSTSTTSDDFCATHVCIPNYNNGTGSIVRCSDGSYSHSGGKQGACSHHGGVAHAMRRTTVAGVQRAVLTSRLASAVAAAASASVGSNQG